MSITSLFSRLSVRARVIALGLIPLIGFLANAAALKSGDMEVGRSFDSVQAATPRSPTPATISRAGC